MPDHILVERIFRVEQNQVQKDLGDLLATLQQTDIGMLDDATLRKMGDGPRKLVDILLDA